MPISNGVKKLITLLLPESVQCVLKKMHYVRIVRSISESHEEYISHY